MVLYREIVHLLGWPNLVEIQNTKVYKNTSKIPSYFIRWYTFVVFIYYITMK